MITLESIDKIATWLGVFWVFLMIFVVYIIYKERYAKKKR